MLRTEAPIGDQFEIFSGNAGRFYIRSMVTDDTIIPLGDDSTGIVAWVALVDPGTIVGEVNDAYNSGHTYYFVAVDGIPIEVRVFRDLDGAVEYLETLCGDSSRSLKKLTPGQWL